MIIIYSLIGLRMPQSLRKMLNRVYERKLNERNR